MNNGLSGIKNIIWALAIVIALLALLVGLLKTVTNLRGFASVGVIGGADGPTEIFIAGPQIFDWADVIAAGVVLVLGLAGYLLLRRLPPKKD